MCIVYMKKILISLLVLGFTAPVFAINDTSKADRQCRKHPEKCQVTPVQEQQLTLGIVQRDIKIGTSQADVAETLGSPNIVTMDSDGHQTWIYDRVSSITSYGNSGFGVGIGGLGGGVVNAGYNKNGGTVQSVQKTLTVVLKFDDNNNVVSFSYHMSSF